MSGHEFAEALAVIAVVVGLCITIAADLHKDDVHDWE